MTTHRRDNAGKEDGGATASPESRERREFLDIAEQLAEIARGFYRRGWALGTSGNFSAVVSRNPLRLAITASGIDKGTMTADQIVEIGESGDVVESEDRIAGPSMRPSAETRLHLVVVRARPAGAVFHTHSVWATLLSDTHAGEGGLRLEGFEMLKGLAGVSTHEHREWLWILENSQDYRQLSRAVEAGLQSHPDAHGFLLRRHGLYTWGKDVQEAKRHVEILEFLLEVQGRASVATNALEHGQARRTCSPGE